MTIPTPAEIRSARLAAGLNQQQAADVYGFVNQNRWSELEHGKRNANPQIWRLWLHLAGLVRIPFKSANKKAAR